MKDENDKEEKSGMQDRVRMKGYVSVYQHEYDENYRDGEKIVNEEPNKFVIGGLRHICTMLGIGVLDDYFGTYNWDMYLGTDTTTSTAYGDSSLVSPIGTGDGTPPDDKSGGDNTEVSTGVWEAKYICTWYSGSVSGTVGEIALYLLTLDDRTFGDSYFSGTTYRMTNRLSAADGEFSSFTIDESKSLTVEWRLRYEFE